MLPQVVQINNIVGDRPIDVMTISIGGNDIGFSNAIVGLLFADPDYMAAGNYNNALEQLRQSINTGDAQFLEAFVQQTIVPGLNNLAPEFAPVADEINQLLTETLFDTETVGLDGLMDEYALVNTALNDLVGGPPQQIYITEYPEPSSEFVDGAIVQSNMIADDIIPPWVEEYIFGSK